MKLLSPCLGLCLAVFILQSPAVFSQQRAIRFYGNGHLFPGKGRVKIPLEQNAINVSDNFTLEFWIQCDPADNNGNVSAAEHGDGWITGNVILDRDVFGNADPGDFGLSIGSAPGLPAGHRVAAFGLNHKNSGLTVQGKTNIADNKWHHLAVTRDGTTGAISLFIDGRLDASGMGPIGRVDYPAERPTLYPDSDPFLVIGAEKHDGGPAYPSFNGVLDELRVSNTVRYQSEFQPQPLPFTPDPFTAALYHFDEAEGDRVFNAVSIQGTDGIVLVAGRQAGPAWEDNSPFLSTEPSFIRSLKAKKVGKTVLLSWKIENTTASYEIQRSNDGKNFVSIKQVDRHDCASCEHAFTDLHPAEGKNFYRIKYVSSGKQKYSPLSFVKIPVLTALASKTDPHP